MLTNSKFNMNPINNKLYIKPRVIHLVPLLDQSLKL